MYVRMSSYLCICLFMNIDHMLFYRTTKWTYSSVDLPMWTFPTVPSHGQACQLLRGWQGNGGFIWGSSTWSAAEDAQKMGKQGSHNCDLANKSTFFWPKMRMGEVTNQVGPICWDDPGGKLYLNFTKLPRTGRRDNCGVFICQYEGCNQQWGNYPKGIGWLCFCSHYRHLLVSEALTHPHLTSRSTPSSRDVAFGTHGTLVYLHENHDLF